LISEVKQHDIKIQSAKDGLKEFDELKELKNMREDSILDALTKIIKKSIEEDSIEKLKQTVFKFDEDAKLYRKSQEGRMDIVDM